MDPFDGKFIMQAGKVEVLERGWEESGTLLSFPDMTRSWYTSPAYQKILRLRTDHLVRDIILVDGVGPDHTPDKYAQHIRYRFAAEAIEGSA